MLFKVEVTDGWTRYIGKVRNDDDPPIEPATYYEVQLGWQAKSDYKDKIKKQLGLMAARKPDGKFAWLAPFEPWVKRVMDGSINYRRSFAAELNNWFDWSALRGWQLAAVKQIAGTVDNRQEVKQLFNVGFGGGKTLVGLLACGLGDNAIVLAPTQAHETWKSEAEKWGQPTPFVSTYESAHKYTDQEWDVLILDEIHRVKSSDTARHKATAQIAANTPIVLGFTGSPLGGGGVLDLRQLRCISPGCFPASESAIRFLFGLDTELVEVTAGRKAYVTKTWDTAKVAAFCEPFVTTVDTSDLIKQLPPKTETIVRLPHPSDYALVRSGASTSRNKSKLTAQLRQCTDGFVELDDGRVVELKQQFKLDWVVEQVEHNDEPIMVVAAWTATIDLLYKRLVEYEPAVITGNTSNKQLEIERFKSGQTRIMLLNAKLSEGMNLQHCRQIWFVSLSANPVDLDQMIARCFRPGQTQGVQVVYLQCADTIDERAYELVTAHKELSEDAINKLLEESADA